MTCVVARTSASETPGGGCIQPVGVPKPVSHGSCDETGEADVRKVDKAQLEMSKEEEER